MSRTITREDIAEIYEQLGVIEMRKAAEAVKSDSNTDESVLDRSFEFYRTADLYREIDQLKPLVRLNNAGLVRSESNNW